MSKMTAEELRLMGATIHECVPDYAEATIHAFGVTEVSLDGNGKVTVGIYIKPSFQWCEPEKSE